jgi:hypothetical protein
MACSNMKNNADTLKFRNAYNTASKWLDISDVK